MIKVTLGAADTQKEKPFPKLMKDILGGDIFYMVSENCGIALTGQWSNSQNPLFCKFTGNYHYFTDYNEPITIQNA